MIGFPYRCRAGTFACQLLLVVTFSASAFAAVTGTVINKTTGQPQAGATVGLNKLGQGGIELIDQAKSDAQGKFTINQDPSGPTPQLLRHELYGLAHASVSSHVLH